MPQRPRRAVPQTHIPASRTPESIGPSDEEMYVRQVPSIMGQSPEGAEATLRQHRLLGNPMGPQRSTEYALGMVSSQDPPAGAPIPADRRVRYWLAAPFSESLVSVPRVVGRELKPGLEAISTARLFPQFAGKERSNRRSGEITRQEPPPGTQVKPGTPVQVWVSVATPPTPPVRVPDIVGLEPQRGFNALSRAGRLRRQVVGRERSNRRAGEITRQEPPPGTQVKPGSSVSVWVAKPPPSPWAIILGALVAIGVVAFIVYWLKRPLKVEVVPVKDYGEQHVAPSPPVPAQPPPPIPVQPPPIPAQPPPIPALPTFHPHWDRGAPQKQQENVTINYELHFDPNLSKGRQRLEIGGTSLIISRKKKQ